jgi:OOP family OmpA-OmpF porin
MYGRLNGSDEVIRNELATIYLVSGKNPGDMAVFNVERLSFFCGCRAAWRLYTVEVIVRLLYDSENLSLPEMNLAKTVFALVFTLIVSASIPSPVFAVTLPRSKPVPVTLGGFSLTPTVSGYLFSGSEQRDATLTYGLKVGYDKIITSIADSLGLEGTVNYFTTKSKADAGDASGYLLRLDALYPFILGEKWMPFLAVGGGGIFIDTASHSEKKPLFNYGAGLKYFLEDHLAVRMDARHLIVYNNVTTRSNFEVGIGMSYYFGKERKKKPVPPPTITAPAIPALEEIESTAGKKVAGEYKPAAKYDIPDVLSSSSLIPLFALTPLLALESSAKLLFQAEAPKESVGEKYMAREVSPAKVKAAPASAEDKTPIQVAVPAGAPLPLAPPIKVEAVPPANAETVSAPVAAEAAQIGIEAAPAAAEEKLTIQIPTAVVAPEKTPPSIATIPSPVISEERKPEPALTLPTAAGHTQPSPAKTEEPVLGAVKKNVVRKLSVEFNSDSSYIKPEIHKEIVELSDIMKSSDSISARIEGYPDSSGDSKHNTVLSEKRVERVQNSLINLGVNPDRISTVVYEPSRPIADNATTEGSQKNHPAVTSVTLSGEAKTMPSPVTAEAAAPVKTEPAPTPAEEKKPVQVAVPGAAPAPPALVEAVPSATAEAVPASVAAGEISAPAKVETAPVKTEPAPKPAEENKPVQVTVPDVAPAPPALVGTVPSATAEAVPAPVAAEEISAPAKVETAPVKTETAPKPTEEKKPVQVSAPAVVPAPPALVETVPSVRAEAVPAPVATGEISAPAEVETAPVKTEPAPTPAGEKKPVQVAVPGAAPAPRALVEAVPVPVAAEEIPAPAKVETAPVKTEPAPTPAEEKKPVQVAVPGAAPAPPALVEAVPVPVAAEEIPAPAKVAPAPVKTETAPIPVEGEKPTRQIVGKKVVRKLTVEFDTDSSYIKRKYYKDLSKIVDIIKNSANASARIEGHTDITGRWSYNIKLSKKRAQSVRSSLIKLGAAPDRISTVGYGPSRPIADNATIEGRRRNRRAVTSVTLIIDE